MQILGSRCGVCMSSFSTEVQGRLIAERRKIRNKYMSLPAASVLQHSVSPLFKHPPLQEGFRQCTNLSVPFPVLRAAHDDYMTEGLAGRQEEKG